MYEKVFYKHYSLEEFYALNLKACQVLQEKEGVEEALRTKTIGN